jgi:hypothetical protein
VRALLPVDAILVKLSFEIVALHLSLVQIEVDLREARLEFEVGANFLQVVARLRVVQSLDRPGDQEEIVDPALDDVAHDRGDGVALQAGGREKHPQRRQR